MQSYQGTTATYLLTARNKGSAPTTATVTITDTLPVGLTLVSASGGAKWVCTTSGNAVHCDHRDPIAPGTSASVTVTATVTATTGTELRNFGRLTGGGDAEIVTSPGSDNEPGTDVAVLDVGNFVNPPSNLLPAGDETLASTGVPMWSMLAVALLLLAAGGALSLTVRRRRAH